MEEYLLNRLFTPVAKAIMKARVYNDAEIVPQADRLFSALIRWATREIKRDKAWYFSLLNAIINKSSDYYKSQGKESKEMYPFGELLEPSSSMKTWVTNLKNGDMVDCIKSYASKKIWSRAELIKSEYNMLKVKFIDDDLETFIQNKFFELAPLKSKSIDFEWRQQLKKGDKVDYYSYHTDWQCYIVEKMSL